MKQWDKKKIWILMSIEEDKNSHFQLFYYILMIRIQKKWFYIF